ncbi:hypothetical protein [Lacticaseibacillus jixiensis]|uniref:hypothetical protein n=1 Tax=Lacticaseibacillus jixiensis TaxID=3231926 RepID=UPI0036F39D45
MSQTLGNFFRQFRQQRQISVRAAAHGGLTGASISRFERGQSDIATSAAIRLMFNIGMTPADLSEQITPKGINTPFKILVDHGRKQVGVALNQYLASCQSNRMTDLLAKLVRLFSDNATTRPNVSIDLEQRVADFLAYPLTWGALEQVALLAILPYCSQELAELLWRRMYVQHQQQLHWSPYTIGFSALIMAATADQPLRLRLDEDIAKLLNVKATQSRTRSSEPLLIAARQLCQGADLQALMNALNTLNAHKLASFITQTISQEGQGRAPWHNNALHDNFDPQLALTPSDNFFSGISLGKLRRQRQLTLAEATGQAWSTSSQSRFESSQSTLAFSSTLQLIQQMGFSFAQLSVGNDSISAFHRTYYRLRHMAYDRENTKHSQADYLAVISQFEADNHDLPPIMLKMQYLALYQTVVNFSPDILASTELTPNLTEADQLLICQYYESLTLPSLLDIEVLVQLVGMLNYEAFHRIMHTVVAHTQSDTAAKNELFNNARFFIVGALYWQDASLLNELEAYFARDADYDYNSMVTREVTYVHLAVAAFHHDTPALRQQAAKVIAAMRFFIPFPDGAYMPNRWLDFAFDKNYEQLEKA